MNHRPLWIGAILGIYLVGGARAAAADPTTATCLAASDASLQLANDHKLLAERAQLLVCAASSCPGDVRKECLNRIDEVNREIPTVVFWASDGAGADLSAVTVTMDGQVLTPRLEGAAVAIDPGEHTFTFETAGQSPITRKLVIEEGHKDRREQIVFATPTKAMGATPPPEATPESSLDSQARGVGTQKVLALVAGGLGVVGLGIGTGFGIVALSKKDDAQKVCPNDCSTPDGVNKREQVERRVVYRECLDRRAHCWRRGRRGGGGSMVHSAEGSGGYPRGLGARWPSDERNMVMARRFLVVFGALGLLACDGLFGIEDHRLAQDGGSGLSVDGGRVLGGDSSSSGVPSGAASGADSPVGSGIGSGSSGASPFASTGSGSGATAASGMGSGSAAGSGADGGAAAGNPAGSGSVSGSGSGSTAMGDGGPCPTQTTDTFAVKVVFPVGWGNTTNGAAGEGNIAVWFLTKANLAMGTTAYSGTTHFCGITFPPQALNQNGALAVGAGNTLNPAFQLAILPSTVDAIAKTFPTDGTLAGPNPGDALTENKTLAGLGLAPGSTYLMESTAWPSDCGTSASSCNSTGSFAAADLSDDDLDGNPGITMTPNAASPDFLPPVSAVLGGLGPAADKIYVALRQELALSGMRTTDCNQASGTAKVTLFDTHVVGCRVAATSNSPAANCTSAQASFVDRTRALYVVQGSESSSSFPPPISPSNPVTGTFTLMQVAGGATCADARSDVP